MKYRRMILLLALCAAVAACDMPNFTFSGKNGKITLDGNVLTLHVDGAPDATLVSSGDLTVDGKTVSISSPQRGLLMLYYQNVMDIREQGVNMGKAGAEAGLSAARHAVSGSSDPNEKRKIDADVEARTHQLALKMCQDQVNLKTVQDQLVAQTPAFKPYGGIFDKQSVDECMKDN